ncbi:uncharacterized protein LOC124410519 isoform X1 [Diprion similis]|uniref:uncharacterized protein LOC124410519 isoform X1 n=1 Tax=Diprion similis TaxID=362088 RepID=UPI001EF88D8C|nr:uncharacterized protein LOC124410519 isoform X1 [Diprion similis]
MAEGRAEGNDKEDSSKAFSGFLSQRKMSSSSEDENIPIPKRPGPDLGIGGRALQSEKEKPGASHSAAPDLPRKKENPFSFKYFLKNDLHTNHQHTGARPKVYPPSSAKAEAVSSSNEAGVYPRNPVELPDFVQDHLVIEQCYLNHDANVQPCLEIDNLPDFALNSMEQRSTKQWNEPKKRQLENLGDSSLDLTISLERRERGDREERGQHEPTVPNVARPRALNLPNLERRNGDPTSWSGPVGFPFDLQLPLVEANVGNANGALRNSSQTSETEVTKSLPDFLSDGPIHNRTSLPVENCHSPGSPEQINQRLILENERLRREQEIMQRQLGEQSRRIQSLESELISRRSVDHEEMANLEKTIEQVEDNLKRSTRRAVNAESAVTSLKQDIKVLRAEMRTLKLENEELRLRMETGCGGSDVSNRGMRRIANDLKTAASTAEFSLRQLISGVDNLRLLASTIENMDRINDSSSDIFPDIEDDNAIGPAL